MNQANLTPMQRAMAALEAFFGDECRQFDREWHTRELAREDTRLGNYWEWVVHQIEAGRQSVDEVIRADMQTICVNVKQVSAPLADQEDEGAAGLYNIAFGKPVQNASRGLLARIALDIFHSKHVIGCLEDFQIDVVDGAGHFIEEDEGENGTYASFGTTEKVAQPFDVRPWSPALYVEVSSDPVVTKTRWSRIDLTPRFVTRLHALQQVCQLHHLKSVQTTLSPDQWSGADQWRPQAPTLHITGDDFWFSARSELDEQDVDTRPVPLTKLSEILGAGYRNDEADPTYRWHLGALYCHGDDAQVVIDAVGQTEGSGE